MQLTKQPSCAFRNEQSLAPNQSCRVAGIPAKKSSEGAGEKVGRILPEVAEKEQ
jgi:hypothetical protein